VADEFRAPRGRVRWQRLALPDRRGTRIAATVAGDQEKRVRNRALAGFALSLALFTNGASAGTLTSATWITEVPGYEPRVAPLGVPLVASGTSTASSISVSLTLPSFEGGLFGYYGVGGYTYRRLVLSGSQNLVATPLMATATMGVPGSVEERLAYHIAQGVNASMLTPGQLILFRLPVSVGGVGSDTGQFIVGGGTHYFTIDHYGWTIAGQTFTGLTQYGAAVSPVAAMGSFALTAMGGGSVLLVAPTRISVDGAGYVQRHDVILTTLQLHFVPEPSTTLLFGAGGVGLLLTVRRRPSRVRPPDYGNTT
jgi:hypothetical protein